MNTLRAPNLGSFAQAKRWFETTVPIRGHKDKVRPLGERRYHRRGSIHMPDPDIVVLKYYETPFVIWSANDDFVVRMPSYVTAFLIDDMDGFVPHGMWFEWNECRPFICFRGTDGVRRYLMEDGDVFRFSVIGDRCFQLHNPKRAVRYAKRRGALTKLVNQRYGAFMDWATVVTGASGNVHREEAEVSQTKLCNLLNIPTHEQYGHIREAYPHTFNRLSLYTEQRSTHYLPFPRHGRDMWFHTPSCEVIDSWMTGDPENWVHVLNLVSLRFGWFNYSRRQYSITMEYVHAFVNGIASHLFRNELFKEIELPDGEVPSRTNQRYFISREIRDITTVRRIVQENVSEL